MLLYVAGPYTAPTEEGIQANIDKASDVSAELWNMGHAVICPHKNTGNFHNVVPNLQHEDWLRGDKQMIAVCDGIVFLPGWENSPGSCEEMDYAKSVSMSDGTDGKPKKIWFYPDIPTLHPTEVNCPVQVQAFRETVGIMNRLHQDKNADYSPQNVAVPGEVGLATRVWDKIIRLMNLVGFHILIEMNDDMPLEAQKHWFTKWLWRGLKVFTQRIVVMKQWTRVEDKKAKFESIEDTLIDAANYPIIWRLFRAGKWGK